MYAGRGLLSSLSAGGGSEADYTAKQFINFLFDCLPTYLAGWQVKEVCSNCYQNAQLSPTALPTLNFSNSISYKFLEQMYADISVTYKLDTSI